MSPANGKPPVVFVHGLWLHAESWNKWVAFFKENSYDAPAASWPGDGPSTEATRQNAQAVARFGVREIADHIAAQLKSLPRKPILIGQSFVRRPVQNLAAPNLTAA